MPGYPLSSGERKPQQFVNAIRALQAGQVNFTGDVTLATGAASTVVKTQLAGPGLTLNPATGQLVTSQGQRVYLFPQTAQAAAEVATGNLYVPRVTTPGLFTIFHSNNSNASRTFSWMVLG